MNKNVLTPAIDSPQFSSRLSSHPIERLVVIDPAVEGAQQLKAGVRSGTQAIVLDPQRDGIEQISHILAGYEGLDSISIVAHGQPGGVQLGSAQLGWQTLPAYRERLRQWRQALADDAAILLYSCQVAAGELGRQFVGQLHNIAGVAVAASSTLVGNAGRGGNWDLDVRSGEIHSSLAFAESVLETYPGILPTFPITGNPIFAGSNPAPGLANASSIYIVDPTNPNATELLATMPGQTATTPAFASSAIARAENGIVYLIEGIRTNQGDTRARSEARLGFFDPTTGQVGIIGNGVGSAAPTSGNFVKVGLSAANSSIPNTLFASTVDATTGNELFTINITTGTVSSFGQIAGLLGGSGDMAFDPENPNRLLIISSNNSTNPNAGQLTLYEVDIVSKTAKVVGTTNIPISSGGITAASMAFGEDGNIYFDGPDPSTPGVSALYTMPKNPSSNFAAQVKKLGSLSQSYSDFATLPVATPTVDLVGTKTASKEGSPLQADSKVNVGDTITYTITVSNNSQTTPGQTSLNLFGISISDPIPTGMTNATLVSATITAGTGAVNSPAIANGKLNASIDLNEGATATFVLTAVVTEQVLKDIDNTVTIKPPDGFNLLNPQPDPTVPDTDPDRIDVTAKLDLNSLPPTVNGAPDNPGASTDPNAVPVVNNVAPGESKTLTGLLGNDRDGNVVSYTIHTLPPGAQGTLLLNGVPVTAGQVITPAQLQQLTFQATGGFTGTSFTYCATDNSGLTSKPGTVQLNPPPIPFDKSLPATPGAATLLVEPIRATDLNPDGTVQFFTITELPPPAQGILKVNGQPVNLNQILSPGQIDDLVFDATPGFTGATFKFTATDDDGAVSKAGTVTLTPRLAVPETDDVVDVVQPNTPKQLVGLGGEPDATINAYRITELPPPDQGTLFLGNPAQGGTPVTLNQSLTRDQISQLFFSPTASFAGATFKYQSRNDLGAFDPTPGIVKLNPIDPLPDTKDASVGVAPGQPVTLTGLGGTPGTNATISHFIILSLPPGSQGVLYLGDPRAGGTPVTAGQAISPDQLNRLVFQPSTFFVSTSFQYATVNSFGAIDSTPGTVTLGGSALPPDTTNSSGTIAPGETLNLTGLSGSDPDGTVASFTILTLPPASQGILYLGNPAQGGTPIVAGQKLTPDQISQLFFQATGNFTGASFTYAAVDNLGNEDPTPGIISLLPPGGPPPLEEPPQPRPEDPGTPIVPIVPAPPADTCCPPVPSLPGLPIDTPPDLEGAPVPPKPGRPENDRVFGGRENDEFFGNLGNDSLDGGEGSDTVLGSDGSPVPVGDGLDEDILAGNQGPDLVKGGEGQDSLYGGQDGDRVFGGKDKDVAYGDRGSDVVSGDLGDDVVVGGTGNPNVPDPDGKDTLYGGEGNDSVFGNQGNDLLIGEQGDDRINGGKEDDRIYGDEGNDTLKGEEGADTLLGSRGTATPIGAAGEKDWLSGNRGPDVIKAGEGEDKVYAGKDNDLVYAGKDNDLVYGDQGGDTLVGDQGDDTLVGGNGNPLDPEIGGNDLIFGLEGNDVADGNQGNDSIAGGNGDDSLRGGLNDDLLWGEAGNDRLFGDRGNDTLCGGDGDDTMTGSNGIPGAPGDGRDKLCGGNGNDSMFGNDDDDTLDGQAGNDTMYGGRGGDILNAGSDNDFVFGDFGSDTIDGGDGDDTLVGSNGIPGSSGDAADIIQAGNGDDLVFANEFDDTVSGGAGNDALYGGKGNDAIAGDAGNDVLFGELGDDVLAGGAGVDVFVLTPANGLDTIADFQVGTDLVALTGGLTFAQIAITQTEGAAIVSVGTQQLARLNGVLATSLSAVNFQVV
jgi:uncharacterized repeat protein (TIGR01451 family)